MNLLRKLDSISRKLESNMINKQHKEQKPEQDVIKNEEEKRKRRDALDLRMLVTTQLLLIKNNIELATFKYYFTVEKRIRERQQEIYDSLLRIGQKNSDVMINHINQLKIKHDSINIKDDLLSKTTSELQKIQRVNRLKEQITSELEKIIFKIIKDLQDALKTRKANKEKKLEDEQKDEKVEHKERKVEHKDEISELEADHKGNAVEQKDNKYEQEKRLDDKCEQEKLLDEKTDHKDKSIEQNNLITLSPVMKHHNRTIKRISDEDSITESFIFVLSKGSLETDKRFVKLVQQTLKDIERYSDPVVVRMGIQFILAKKYIDDIIFLKQKALDKKYLVT